MNLGGREFVWRKGMWKSIVPYAVILAVGFMLFCRARIGFIWSDEPFYFSTAWRFVQGDIPFVDEWYPSQIYSVLLVPYVAAWKALTGSLDGILLFTRYLYAAVQTLMAAWIYAAFHKRGGKLPSLAAALLFETYCKNQIITFSYYSMELDAAFAWLLLLYSAHERGVEGFAEEGQAAPEKRRRDGLRGAGMAVPAGILYGIVVLCNPFLVILYAVELFLMWRFPEKFHVRRAHTGMMALSTLLPLLACGGSILLRAGIGPLADNLNQILRNRTYFGTMGRVRDIARGVGGGLLDFWYVFLFWIPELAILWYQRARGGKIRQREKMILTIGNGILLAVGGAADDATVFTFGKIFILLAACGILSYMLTEEKTRFAFLLFYLQGLGSGILYSVSSDTGYSAFIHGLVPAGIAGVMLMGRQCRELFIRPEESPDAGEMTGRPAVSAVSGRRMKENRTWVTGRGTAGVALMGAVAVAVVVQMQNRWDLIYRAGNVQNQRYELTDGPAEGIYAEKNLSCRYNAIQQTLDSQDETGGNLYIAGFFPAGYLMSDLRCGTFTEWRIYADVESRRSPAYYHLHKDKFPDVIVLLSQNYGEDNGMKAGSAPGEPIVSPENRWFASWLCSSTIRTALSRGYCMENAPCGAVVRREHAEADRASCIRRIAGAISCCAREAGSEAHSSDADGARLPRTHEGKNEGAKRS